MFKKIAVNTISSLVTMILEGIAFIFLGIFVADLFGSFTIAGLIVLFLALLGFGYYIGRQLYYDKKTGFISIVVLPMAILVAVFGLFMVLAAVVSTILQHPATLWVEALNFKADNSAVLYVVAFAHYLIYALAIFVGTCKKQSK
jgi:hypothetical protein